jgi:hypothetical protein
MTDIIKNEYNIVKLIIFIKGPIAMNIIKREKLLMLMAIITLTVYLNVQILTKYLRLIRFKRRYFKIMNIISLRGISKVKNLIFEELNNVYFFNMRCKLDFMIIGIAVNLGEFQNVA